MLKRIASLFVIKTGFEAGLIIYALALGAASRGFAYRADYPGAMGWLLFGACLLTVFIAGASIVDGVRAREERKPHRRALRRVAARARAG